MKIALLSSALIETPPSQSGGMETLVADLAAALAESGNEVTLFACAGSKPIGDYEVVECIDPIDDFARKWSEVNWCDREKEMFEFCRDQLFDFDIIHGHNWCGSESILDLPNVFHTHHSSYLSYQFSPRVQMTAISYHMKLYTENYLRTRCGVLWEKIPVAYNGINLADYPFQEDKGDRLLFVGRFHPFKGAHHAIQVAADLNMGLDLVGSPHDPEYFEQLKTLANGMDVVFHIDATQAEKVKLYQNAKCTLMPSQMGEPFGLVAIESMACGTPVIAFHDGALGELIRDECGILTTPGSALEMSQAVSEIKLTSPGGCRNRAEQFSRENMAKAYLRIYNHRLEETFK